MADLVDDAIGSISSEVAQTTESPTQSATEPTSTSDTTATTSTPTGTEPTSTPEPTPSTTESSTTTDTPTPTPTTTSTTTTTTPPSTSTETSSETTSTTWSSIPGTTKSTTVIVTSTDTAGSTQTTGNAGDSTTTSIGETSATATPTSQSDGGSGLSAGGTIAVAVVVPVVTVALIVLAALYFWRKWKSKKAAEEERRKEVEEYGYNPNNDPSLPPIMGGSAYEPKDDASGYRGWGTTSAGRKASTNMSSSAGVGLAMSEAGSQPGYHHATTPSEGTIQYSEGHGAPGETEPLGILGAVPTSNNRTTDIHRGPSNASSAYSAANRSDVSDESHMSATHPTAAYYGETPYYDDMQQQYGGYSEGPYGGGQPVIRDVQARRNTRIESPSVFPRQGNAGIAQNF